MVIVTMPDRKVICGYCDKVLFDNPEMMTREDRDKLVAELVLSDKKSAEGKDRLIPINVCGNCYDEHKDEFECT